MGYFQIYYLLRLHCMCRRRRLLLPRYPLEQRLLSMPWH
ncbi:hypothetical protein ACHAXA_006597 [Cyclostephanos tholiformis]|uniref:Uncharacterized protein n=1 Tax=Cyclostephanos tholiformis TaxID=382380 RepID=A0ABD3R0W2_9STRA